MSFFISEWEAIDLHLSQSSMVPSEPFTVRRQGRRINSIEWNLRPLEAAWRQISPNSFRDDYCRIVTNLSPSCFRTEPKRAKGNHNLFSLLFTYHHPHHHRLQLISEIRAIFIRFGWHFGYKNSY